MNKLQTKEPDSESFLPGVRADCPLDDAPQLAHPRVVFKVRGPMSACEIGSNGYSVRGRRTVVVNAVKEVGKKVRLLRMSRFGPKMTQEDLARRAEISVSFLSMIERGERAPHLDTITRLAAALQVPLTELFTFDSDPDKLDQLYRPLIDYCRKQQMTRRDVDKLLAVAKSMFG